MPFWQLVASGMSRQEGVGFAIRVADAVADHHVITDSGWLTMIFVNFLSNACRGRLGPVSKPRLPLLRAPRPNQSLERTSWTRRTHRPASQAPWRACRTVGATSVASTSRMNSG